LGVGGVSKGDLVGRGLNGLSVAKGGGFCSLGVCGHLCRLRCYLTEGNLALLCFSGFNWREFV
jgi:hypothetical protein